MAIIITKNGKGAVKLAQTPPELEDYLQQYVSDNPDSLPLDDIKEGTKLLVIGREFETGSGPIDVLAVDGDGAIYIIETKLYKNPDKRLVIAQMLDYGAALWKDYPSGDGFLRDIDESVAESKAGGLRDRLRSLYAIDDQRVAEVEDAIKANLSEGNIKFVVLMDKLHERLRDLIVFINAKSNFTIYAVEIEFYKHEGMEIAIPKIFGAEAAKSPPSTTGSRQPKFGSKDEFFAAVEGESAKTAFRRLLRFGDDLGATYFLGAGAMSVRLPDPRGGKNVVSLFRMDRYGEVHIGYSVQQLETLGLPTKLGTEYAKSLASIFPGVTPHPKWVDNLSRGLTAEEVDKALDQFKDVVGRFVKEIEKASAT